MLASKGFNITALVGNALTADESVEGQFDHILLMGPLYHLLEESERIQAVYSALKLLKPQGIFFASFINMFAGMIYAMKIAPEIINDQNESEFYNTVLNDASFAGQAFTQAFFINQKEVLPFMEQFPLDKLHYFGQESILSPCENNIMIQPQEVIDGWLACQKNLLNEKTC